LLGGEDDVVAPSAGQCLADDGFGFAVRVGVRGVDEGDARIQCVVDEPDRRIVVGFTPGPGLDMQVFGCLT
jgi:hypothetical protein